MPRTALRSTIDNPVFAHPTEPEVLFGNEAWVVTTEALEHRAAAYSVPIDRLGERRQDGLWFWPVHLMEKRWCDPIALAEAFGAALALVGIEPDAQLAASFRLSNGSAMLQLVAPAKAPPTRRPSATAVALGVLVSAHIGQGSNARARGRSVREGGRRAGHARS